MQAAIIRVSRFKSDEYKNIFLRLLQLIVLFLIGNTLWISNASAGETTAQLLPTMRLEGQYQAPFPETVIQRWRDPQTGVLCYLYVPIRVQNFRDPKSGELSYGNNNLGAMSCLVLPAQTAQPAQIPSK